DGRAVVEGVDPVVAEHAPRHVEEDLEDGEGRQVAGRIAEADAEGEGVAVQVAIVGDDGELVEALHVGNELRFQPFGGDELGGASRRRVELPPQLDGGGHLVLNLHLDHRRLTEGTGDEDAGIHGNAVQADPNDLRRGVDEGTGGDDDGIGRIELAVKDAELDHVRAFQV